MSVATTSQLDELRSALAEDARDLKLNLQSIFNGETLSVEQSFGCALTSAYFVKDDELVSAVTADAEASGVGEAVVSDAKAAAALMGMNAVYYRFRHLLGKDSYNQKPARLRMQRMASPKTGKAEFELFSLSAAVLAGCATCVKAHEASVLKHGLTEEHAHDAARIASVIHGVSIALAL